jgi:hypothetical protein
VHFAVPCPSAMHATCWSAGQAVGWRRLSTLVCSQQLGMASTAWERAGMQRSSHRASHKEADRDRHAVGHRVIQGTEARERVSDGRVGRRAAGMACCCLLTCKGVSLSQERSCLRHPGVLHDVVLRSQHQDTETSTAVLLPSNLRRTTGSVYNTRTAN